MSSKSFKQKTGQIVVPGDRLGVIEEFTPNTGTFVKDGVIYAMVVGHALPDLVTRHIRVIPAESKAPVPKVGDVVVGEVSNVQPDNATVRIFQVGEKQLSGGVFIGILHVSDAHMRYVDSMFEVCRAGDVVRARVISTKNQRYHLSTKDKDLGVVYGFCTNCGGLLEAKRLGMRCMTCGKVDKRKTAFDYGKGLVYADKTRG
ncbi:MAG: exosome complex RNA-binding protein Csl4 [Candidatus Bathyarchaeia archaeon]